MNGKKVLIVYTGGTIGMTKTENGYAPQRGHLSEALANISDLGRIGMPEIDVYEMPKLLDSSNISVGEWNGIASVIYDRYDKYDGFVILHGTDTMAYTASALSFMLDGNSKPIVLTGSQIPLGEIRSDGVENIVSSVIVASDGVINEVALCFGSKVLRGNRATKMSADGLMAFDSPNYPHLADIGIKIKYNHSMIMPKKNKPLRLLPFSEVPIGVLKVFPGIQFSLFESIMTEKLSGIVLETFGTGNIPDSDGKLLPIVRRAFDGGVAVVVCSQCPAGTVSLGTYETSAHLKRAGAISGKDMTTEAAVAKLYHLFSIDRKNESLATLMQTSIAGELT